MQTRLREKNGCARAQPFLVRYEPQGRPCPNGEARQSFLGAEFIIFMEGEHMNTLPG